MKNYLKISLILCSIALICAAILAAMNLLTADTIAKNDADTYTETMQQIYADYDADASNSAELTNDELNAGITKIVTAKDKDGKLLGTVYTVTGKNAYGTITLLVAIAENGAVHQIEFLENSQSFASTVAAWVKKNFANKGTESHEIGAYTEVATINPNGDSDYAMSQEDYEKAFSDENVKCGATYAAKLVRTLVQTAVNDYAKEAK